MGVKISEMTELPIADLAEGDFAPIERGASENYRVDIGALAASIGGGALLASNNLDDLDDIYAALANLGISYRIGSFFIDTPAASETLVIHPVTSSVFVFPGANRFTFPANFANSRASCGVPPTADFVMTVYRNPTFTGTVITGGTVIGTVTILTSYGASFATTDGVEQVVNGGDVIAIAAPETPDAMIACVGITLSALFSIGTV